MEHSCNRVIAFALTSVFYVEAEAYQILHYLQPRNDVSVDRLWLGRVSE